jgi:general secretion pathway protein F
MTERQISNRVHREAFNIATDNVLEGESMSKALTRTGCFPDLVLDQIAIGENTGNIVPSLRRVATNFQKVVSNKLNIFTKVIGNGVLMMVFIFVGFLAFAIVQAVFQLSNSIKQ